MEQDLENFNGLSEEVLRDFRKVLSNRHARYLLQLLANGVIELEESSENPDLLALEKCREIKNLMATLNQEN